MKQIIVIASIVCMVLAEQRKFINLRGFLLEYMGFLMIYKNIK